MTQSLGGSSISRIGLGGGNSIDVPPLSKLIKTLGGPQAMNEPIKLQRLKLTIYRGVHISSQIMSSFQTSYILRIL